MEKRIILAAANHCFQQIMQTTDRNIVFSWGISKKWAVEVNGLPALALKVNGFIHRGWVYIALNYRADLYEIYTSQELLKNPVLVESDIYFDQLGTILDRIIETDDDTTAEYVAKVNAWLGEL